MQTRKVTARTRLIYQGKSHPVGAQLEVPTALADRWQRLGAVAGDVVSRTPARPIEAEPAAATETPKAEPAEGPSKSQRRRRRHAK